MNLTKDKEFARKFNNFMVYEATKRILLTKELALKMHFLMEEANLSKLKNPFFVQAKQINSLSLDAALTFAFHWGKITKRFTSTVLISLRELSEKISLVDLPPAYVLDALKEGIEIISNDLNTSSLEIQSAPDGIHCDWWETRILTPLMSINNARKIPILPKTQRLLRMMNKLARNPLGFTVQLYVIDAIALDIILIFLPLLSKVKNRGQKVFKSSDIISWVMEHIHRESIYQKYGFLEDNQLLNLISTVKNQQAFFLVARNYIYCWNEVLEEFAELFKIEPIAYHSKVSFAKEMRMLQ